MAFSDLSSLFSVAASSCLPPAPSSLSLACRPGFWGCDGLGGQDPAVQPGYSRGCERTCPCRVRPREGLDVVARWPGPLQRPAPGTCVGTPTTHRHPRALAVQTGGRRKAVRRGCPQPHPKYTLPPRRSGETCPVGPTLAGRSFGRTRSLSTGPQAGTRHHRLAPPLSCEERTVVAGINLLRHAKGRGAPGSCGRGRRCPGGPEAGA